jgi:hypothetical protein
MRESQLYSASLEASNATTQPFLSGLDQINFYHFEGPWVTENGGA